MARALRLIIVTLLTALVWTGTAHARGGNYSFDGATPKQQAQVKAALGASSFDWSVIPVPVTVHVQRGIVSHATPGHVWLDGDLLGAGMFAWATVQDEFAHQVDFFLFDDAKRALLNTQLGGKDWCYGVTGLSHSDYGCERFASTLVWSYWQSPRNAYKPTSKKDESAAMAPAKFRALMGQLLAASA